MKLKIEKAQIEQINNYPGEETPSCVLVLKAPLGKVLADRLRCRDVVYDGDVIRGSIEGKVSLSLVVNEADLMLAGTTEVTPNTIHKFKVIREEHGKGDERDVALFLSFRSKFSGKEPVRLLSNFLNSVNSAPFNVVIDGKQESFDFDGESVVADESDEVDA
jgi:hypothetical protein